jgi:PAS domain-containing protein
LLSKKIKIYRIIILPVALHGCETWSLILREECRLRVFENRVLRRIFGSKRGEVTGEWRKLLDEELNDLYSFPNIIRVIKLRRVRWVGHVVRMGERRGAYRVLMTELRDQREINHLEDPDVDGKVILRWFFRK